MNDIFGVESLVDWGGIEVGLWLGSMGALHGVWGGNKGWFEGLDCQKGCERDGGVGLGES